MFLCALLISTPENIFCLTLQELEATYEPFASFALTQDEDAAEPNIPAGKTKSLIILEIFLSIAAYDRELYEPKPHDERRIMLGFVNDLGISLSDDELEAQKAYLSNFINQLAAKWPDEQ